MQGGGRKDKIMIKMTKLSTILQLTGYFQVFREAPGIMREACVKHQNTQNADTVGGKYTNIIKIAKHSLNQGDVEKNGYFVSLC